MIQVMASNCPDPFKEEIYAVIQKTTWGQKPENLRFSTSFFGFTDVSWDKFNIELLDEEKSKSFLGSAGFGLVGAAVLGPLGLIAGALAGGNKTVGLFGVSFTYEGKEVKLVMKTTNKDDIQCLKTKAFSQSVAS